jgi:predicted site-specific integrase-resolvase
MKLSDWAKTQGICYRTAYNWFHAGKMPCRAEQLPSGTILVYPDAEVKPANKEATVYCRVSTYERKDCLTGQAERCAAFAAANGISVSTVVKEIASGMNDKRPKLMKILTDPPEVLIVENKDRLTRFGFNYIKTLLNNQGCIVMVLNESETDEQDLMKDLVSIITSFCCRLYGMRRGINRAKEIKERIKG